MGWDVSKKHGVYLCVYCVSVCKTRKSFFFFFFSWQVSQHYLQGCCVSEGCGLRLAIRAKSSTNPAGRGLGLRFQRGDLEKRE